MNFPIGWEGRFFMAHGEGVAGSAEVSINTLFLLANIVFVFVAGVVTIGVLYAARHPSEQKNRKLVEWILRLGVIGIFLPHGLLALQGYETWIAWLEQLFGLSDTIASLLLLLIGVLDTIVVLFVFLKPMRFILLWAAVWGFATALVVPLLGGSLLEFAEGGMQWAMPLALLFLKGWPRNAKALFT